MLVPLYGFVEGDTLSVLVLAHDDMKVSEVMRMLRSSVAVRVDESGEWVLFYRGEPVPLGRTVAEAGLEALTRIDLRRREGVPP